MGVGIKPLISRVESEAGLVRGVGVPGAEPRPRGAGAALGGRAAAALRHPRRRHARRRHPLRRRQRPQLPEGTPRSCGTGPPPPLAHSPAKREYFYFKMVFGERVVPARLNRPFHAKISIVLPLP